MSRNSKTKDKPIKISLLDNPNVIQNILEHLDRCIVGIDQALDSTGVTILHPDGVRLMQCIQGFIKEHDLTTKSIGEWTQLKKGRGHWGAYTFYNGKGILVYSKDYLPSNEPEWKICQNNAEQLKKDIIYVAGNTDTTVVIESLVIQGVSSSIAILPILGILYSTLFQTLLTTGHNIGELGNGTWKKIISGAGNTKKKDIQTAWRGITGIPFSDDETDSISIAIASAFDLYLNKEPDKFIKYSKGRIRPFSKEG